MTVEDGVVSVGRVGAGAFLEWRDPEVLAVNYVGFSASETDAEFRFCDMGK